MKMSALIMIFAVCTSVGYSRPNIVVIMVDDLGAYTCHPYGCDTNVTPRIDSIASSGMRFGNAHAYQACAASKAALLTAREAFRTGVTSATNGGNLSTNEVTIGNLASDAGYATGNFAKWNAGSGSAYGATQDERIRGFGFQENLNFIGATIQYLVDEEAPNTNDNFWPYLYKEAVLDFIDDHADEPFLIFYTPGLAHSPFDVGTPDHPESTNDTDTVNFWYKMECLDGYVGEVLDKLESSGVISNTVVFFSGDNGTPVNISSSFNGTNVVGGKITINQTATWVPQYVMHKGVIDAGSYYDGLTQATDITATIADYIGVQFPSSIPTDGKSFRPQLNGDVSEHRDMIILGGTDGGSTPTRVFDKSYRYMGSRYEGFPYYHNLYDISGKPFGEELVVNPEHAGYNNDWYSATERLKIVQMGYVLDGALEKTSNGDNPWGGHEDEKILLTDSTNYIPIEVISLAVSGASTVAHETTSQYEAVATYTDLTESNVTASAVWTVDNANTTIDAGELIVGTMSDTQTANIAASFGGLTNTLAVELQGVPIDYALVFDGADDIQFPAPLLPATADFDCSIEFSAARTDANLILLSQYENTSMGRFLLRTDGTMLRLFVDNGASDVLIIGGTVVPDTDYTVRAIREDGVFSLYQDATLIGQATNSISLYQVSNTIFGATYGGTTADFEGNLYNITIDGIAEYEINEGTGSYIYDSSGNNHTGTITGATWSEL